MTAAAIANAESARMILAPPQTYKLPRQLARHVWRTACNMDETRPDGASESGIMEVAWETFLALTPDENMKFVERCFGRRGAPTEYDRKSYSLPLELVQRVTRRLNELKVKADDAGIERPTLWELAEAAQVHLVELLPDALSKALDRYNVRKKRRA